MKKLIGMLITIAVILTAFCISASAESYSGTCGEAISWSLDTETGALTISGTGDMPNFEYSDVRWDGHQEEIISVSIGSGVTSIANFAFSECTALKSIEIADTVASIGEAAFYGTALQNVVLGRGVKIIGNSAFAACSNLSSITIPDGVAIIGDQAFNGCSAFTSIEIPDSVTKIGEWAFYDCYNLASIELPDSVTSIGSMAFDYTAFYDNASNWDNNVLYIGNHLIEANDSLRGDYTVKDGTKTIATNAFCGLYRLTNVELPDSVTVIGESAFDGCGGLESITMTDSITSIGVCAFNGCYSLAEITIPNNITSIADGTFRGCSALASITIPDGVTSIGESAFNGCSALENVSIGKGVKTIGNNAFGGCEKLAEISFPDGVESIGTSAFSWCTALASISIPNSVTNLGEYAFDGTAFYNDESNWSNGILYIGLHLVTVNDAVGENIEVKDGTRSIGKSAFSNRSNIKSVILPDSLVSIGDFAFNYCSALTSISVPDKVEKIGDYTFYSCRMLESVVLGSGIKSIGEEAFYNCSKLADIKLSEGITSIGNSAFNKCTALTSIKLPDSVETIGERAFVYCTDLESITMPKNLKEIKKEAFSGCNKLSKLEFFEGLETIGEKAFAGCTNLEKVTFPTTLKSVGSAAFSRGNGVQKVPATYISDLSAWLNIDFVTNLSPPGGDLYINGEKVTEIIIPDGVTDLKPYTLWFSGLEKVVLPEGITHLKSGTIGNLGGVGELVIPKSLKKIDHGAAGSEVISISDIRQMCEMEYPLMGSFWGAQIKINGVIQEDLVIPEGVTKINSGAFVRCDFRNIYLPASLETIGKGAFEYAQTYTVYVPEENEHFRSVDGVLFSKDMSTLVYYSAKRPTKTYRVPGSVNTIGYGAFSFEAKIETMIIPKTITNLEGGTTGKNLYYDGSESEWLALTGAYFTSPSIKHTFDYNDDTAAVASGTHGDNLTWSLNPIGVLTIKGSGEMANLEYPYDYPWKTHLSSITEIIIEDGVTSIANHAFDSHNKATSVTIADSVETIGEYAFAYCSAIKEIPIIHAQNIQPFAFKYCSVLPAVYLADTVKIIGESAFADCVKFTDYIMADKITEIGKEAFLRTALDENIRIPASVVKVGAYAFKDTDYYDDSTNWVSSSLYIDDWIVSVNEIKGGSLVIKDGTKHIADMGVEGCYSLTDITIPYGVETIGDEAFVYCVRVKSIVIPNTVKSIGDRAFYRWDSIKDVYYRGTAEDWQKISIGSIDNYDLTEDAAIHYSDESTVSPDYKVNETDTGVEIVFNSVAAYEDEDLYYAEYDENGVQLSIQCIKVDVSTGENAYPIASDCNNTIKVFLWDDMRPLAY